MDDLAKLIPTNVSSWIGLVVCFFFVVAFKSFAEKAGILLWQKYTTWGKEKRHDDRGNENGIERRSENKSMQIAITELMASMTFEKRVMSEFISTFKESHREMKETLGTIERKQTSNWARIFEEEIPALHEKIKRVGEN